MDINNPKHMLNPKNPEYSKNIKALGKIVKKLTNADKIIKKDFSINK